MLGGGDTISGDYTSSGGGILSAGVGDTASPGNNNNGKKNDKKNGEKQETKSENTNKIKGNELVFSSKTKSPPKLSNEMLKRGWTEDSVRQVVNNPYTTRKSVDKSRGNPATVFYTQDGAYVVVNNITKEVIQVGDRINPMDWQPDNQIINPYIPKGGVK